MCLTSSWTTFWTKYLTLQGNRMILQEESFLQWEPSQLSPRPKTCQYLPSLLLHNSHSQEPWRRRIFGFDPTEVMHSNPPSECLFTPDRPVLILAWLNREGAGKEGPTWQEDESLTAAEGGEISCDATTTNGQHRVEEGKVRSWREKGVRR